MAKENAVALKQVQEETINLVLARINDFQKDGQLTLPKDYAPENALKSAWFVLRETKDRQGNLALEKCSTESITNALFEMVVKGLNPMKKQCAFIVYSDKLNMVMEYHGTIALAKRYGGISKTPAANVVYEGDEFEYAFNTSTGIIEILKHETKLENIDITKIRGAYAVLTLDDGSKHVEVMSIAQIRKAWDQGAMKGKSPAHNNFTDQMAKKTVISRACKLFISSSDDGSIIDLDKENTVPVDNNPPSEKENTKTLNIEEAEEVAEPAKEKTETKEEKPKETVETPLNKIDGNEQVTAKF